MVFFLPFYLYNPAQSDNSKKSHSTLYMWLSQREPLAAEKKRLFSNHHFKHVVSTDMVFFQASQVIGINTLRLWVLWGCFLGRAFRLFILLILFFQWAWFLLLFCLNKSQTLVLLVLFLLQAFFRSGPLLEPPAPPRKITIWLNLVKGAVWEEFL